MQPRPRLDLPQDPILDSLWAKSPPPGADRGETLAGHTVEVLLRLAQLRRLRPRLALEVGEPRLWHRLYWAAFLHDWGKAARGFQAQVRPGGSRWGYRHEVLSLGFLPYVTPVGSDDFVWMAAAIASHHRDRRGLQAQYDPDASAAHQEGIRLLVEQVEEGVLAALWRWLTSLALPWAEQLGFGDLEAPSFPTAPETLTDFRARAPHDIAEALACYYDWVDEGSILPEKGSVAPLNLRGVLTMSDHAGSAHAPPFQPVPLPSAEELLRSYLEKWGSAHDHQRLCARAVGSVLLVAPTGSGKTEAALLWAANQRSADGTPAPRLFYLLPYQASMNAMLNRLSSQLSEEQGTKGCLVGLQHGKARHALYRRYLEREQSPEGAARETHWARELVRLHLPAIRVLSPYQILRAFYRLKGYEAVLADAQGGLFICDEIHAYEVDRLALIVAMLQVLGRDFGGRFCLMSATFPSLLRGWLDEAVGPLKEVRASQECLESFRRHRVRVAPGDLLDPANLAQAREAVREGLNVLVCCNTVARAQAAFQSLRDLGPELIHSRMNSRDRGRKEQFLRDQVGTGVDAKARGALVVATQVVEVSLDVDFDMLFTDPAPLDALLQRFGRVNRGRRAAFRDVVVFTAPVVDQRPYSEALVRRALEVLQREFGMRGDLLEETEVSGWLDEVYSGSIGEEWQAAFRLKKREFEQVVLSGLRAFGTSDDLEDLFYRAFDGVDVLPACLEDEYAVLTEQRPLEAAELLVPIRWGQLRRLLREEAVVARLEDGTPVVERPYSPDTGLEI